MPEGEAADTGGAVRRNPFTVPSFLLLWLNQVTFFFVSNALRFVYGWLVLDGLGRDESVQGLAVFLLGIGNLLFLLPAGVWADRFNRRTILISTQTAFALVLVATAVALGQGANSVGLVVVSAVFAGVAQAIGTPVRQSLVPAVLPKDLLVSGIAASAIAMTASLVFGPVTAKAIGDWQGFAGAYWYLAILLLIGVGFVFFMRVPEIPDHDRQATDGGMLRSVRESFSFVSADPAMRTLFFLLGIGGGLMTPLMFVILQARVKEFDGYDSGDVAPILACMGVGIAVSSMIVMARGDRPGKGVKFMRAMLVGTTTLALMGLANQYWQLVILGLVMGLAGGFFINMNQSLVQANTPNAVMGRVMSLFTLVQAGLLPIGALVLGILASRIGTGPTMVGTAAVGFVAVLTTYLRATAIRELS